MKVSNHLEVGTGNQPFGCTNLNCVSEILNSQLLIILVGNISVDLLELQVSEKN